MADYLNIAGRVRTTASDGVAMEAQEVKDLNLNKSQQEVNADVQTELGDRYTKEETYNREELNELITTPDVNRVYVIATNLTTAVTDLLPATGSSDTLYNVGNWDGTQYDTTVYSIYGWDGTAYVCLAVRSSIGEVYDISANNPDGQGNPTPYADLAAALGTNGENIPADIRRGGMSIKFIQGTVQSSDNNYVRYNLLANEFTTDVSKWAIDDSGVYVENDEYLYVRTDNDGKILWAIKADGSIYYGAGVPQQVKDYIQEKIDELSLDEYEDIVAFLDGIEEGDKTLQQLLDEKVDKEEGKGLIDEDYAASMSTVENSDFLEVATDNDDKIIEATRTNGRKILSAGLDIQGGVSMDGVSVIINETDEYIAVETDSEDRILGGRKSDGTKTENCSIETPTFQIEHISDPAERNDVKLDREEKIISYRDKQGTLYEEAGIVTPSLKTNNANIKELVTEIDIPLATDELIYLEKPKFAEFYFKGELPTDESSTRTPTELEVLIKVDRRYILRANVEMSIQGHGSALWDKKGYTLDFKNADGDELSIKFGNMVAVDSFHYKAYFTDRTHSRGIAGATIWRDIVKQLGYPYSKINNKPLSISDNQKIDAFCIADANYCEDGFPTVAFLNGEFLGLYTLKLKKTRSNYAMEKSNKSEIFLDNLGFEETPTYPAYLNEQFDYHDWDLKNPKLKNYEEGGEITDATVLSNINRLFDFTSSLSYFYRGISDAEADGWTWSNNTWTKANVTKEGDYTDAVARTLRLFYANVATALDNGWTYHAGVWTKDGLSIEGRYADGDVRYLLPVFDKHYLNIAMAEKYRWTWLEGVWSHDVFGDVEADYTDAAAQELPTAYTETNNFIVLPLWCAWMVHAELIGNGDINGNNQELLTWDSEHWSILPYDMDHTVGLDTVHNIHITDDGFITKYFEFHKVFRGMYNEELMQMYTKLRKNGFIDTYNLYQYYVRINSNIPRQYQKEDKEKWPNTVWVNGYPVIEQIYTYLHSRIEFLDSVWLITE